MFFVGERFIAKPGPVFKKGLTQGVGSKLRLLYNFLGKIDFCLSLSGIFKNVKTSFRLSQGHTLRLEYMGLTFLT